MKNKTNRFTAVFVSLLVFLSQGIVTPRLVLADLKSDQEALARAKNHAEEYQKLADSERKQAEEASRKVPKEFWEETARKSKELAEMHQKEADKFKKEAEELAKKVEAQKGQPEPLKNEVPENVQPPVNPPAAPPISPAPQEVVPKNSGEEGDSSEPIPVEEFLGKWKDEKSGEEFTIEPAYQGEKPELVLLRGKHLWSGEYEKGKFTFKYTPKFDEMNSEAPEWSRKKVEQEGKLIWILELEPPKTCGEITLNGSWYPGEIKWKSAGSVNNAETSGGEAHATGEKGKPVPVKFYKIEFVNPQHELAVNGNPQIIIRLVDEAPAQDAMGEPLAFLTDWQLFFVEVAMARKEADAIGDSLTINFKTTQSKLSTSLKLQKQRQIHGLVFYTHDQPIQVTHPFGGDDQYLWHDWGRFIEGEDLEISYNDNMMPLKVYRHASSVRIAQFEDGFINLSKVLQEALVSAELSRKQKEEVHKKLQ